MIRSYIFIRKALSLLAIVVLASSCLRYKKLVYLQSLHDTTSVVKSHQYRIHANDNLKIEFTSTDPGTSALLNKETGLPPSSQINNASMYITSYSVDSLGNIEIPLLGTVQAEGYTLNELSSRIDKQLSSILKLKNVSVKMANYRVSILGEVKSPNTYYIYNDETTILQAIAMAGDLTDVASRKAIKVVRHNIKNDRAQIIEVDLNSPDITRSQGYYIFPNDVIYVAPAKAKAPRANLPIWQVSLTAITAVLLIINIVMNSNSN